MGIMRNMAIDMGNSRIKVGFFSDHELLKVLEDLEKDDLIKVVADEGIDQIIVSSVVSDLPNFEKETGLNNVLKLTPELEVPIKNAYRTPTTLGMDRLAGVIGAFCLYRGFNCLVIDTGTTITYDFLDAHGSFHGGGIGPGIELRFKSLAEHTEKLPLIEGAWDTAPLIGNDTKGSIKSGVLNGVLSEIEGIIRRYGHKFSNLKVIICGGDASYFEDRVKAPIFVAPHLVLIGLNSILMYHAQNK